ncbi:autotransporter strand-loop-strand O-heptosyltransferase [Swingsia samuiensis]|uniref:Autotransporter strand-loop-strand O-heptosyltransferase n=1 Tax=Swingsia samuiensis TaxID=1293412 RepID=A0A4Y6UKB1_9PROT|nr:autotransporter strand-loop-strand O-heptosyltransferase [Swingsia samuiensis]QDH16817.1 autotransporter strand-loop-strand O-heptosyltransferase [Swingsia samuiensis]
MSEQQSDSLSSTTTEKEGLPSAVTSEASASPSSAKEEKQESPYVLPSQTPAIEGKMGIRFDFNDGARVMVPPLADKDQQWHVRLSDYSMGNILFDAHIPQGMASSTKKFFVPFELEVWLQKKDGTEEKILDHKLSLKGQRVLVQLPVGTLGDTLAWLPPVIRFAKENEAHVTCTIADVILPLVEKANPEIKFVGKDKAAKIKGFADDFYATYKLGLFFQDKEFTYQPTDFRHVGLHRTAAYILGINPWDDSPPALDIPDGDTPPIKEPYVVIATQASTQCKYWNNPAGWHEVVDYLKRSGFRVVCIDQKMFHGTGYVYNHIPFGVEDETGNRSLGERARWLKHASFFVGLSSGLSWLAHAAGTPVVMISGFTHPNNEFFTPYRVINWHTCNSCWNDPAHQFDHSDFLWCPRHKGTDRQFECTRLITGKSVINIIEKLMKDKKLISKNGKIEKQV